MGDKDSDVKRLPQPGCQSVGQGEAHKTLLAGRADVRIPSLEWEHRHPSQSGRVGASIFRKVRVEEFF